MSVASLIELLEAGVHFGHQTQHWNPKMKPYIYGARNGIYILDLRKTTELLDAAYDAVREYAAKGRNVLFVGTKKQAAEVVAEEANRAGAYYINRRWLGGIKEMRGLPDIIFVVDQAKEDIAIKEANKLNIPVICLADTNANPEGINYIIPGNDDAIRSIKLITSKLADAVLEGKQLRENNANSKGKVEAVTAADAGVEEAATV